MTPADIVALAGLPPYPSGVATMYAQLLAGLVARGHRVRVIAPATAGTRDGARAFAERHPELRITWYPLPHFEMFDQPGSDEFRRLEGEHIRERLRHALAEARPDVLLLGRDIYAWYGPAVGAAHRIPSVLTVHGGATNWMLDGLLPPDARRYLLSQLRRVDVILTVARHWAERLAALGLGPVRAVPNPVDLARFAPGPKDPGLLAAHGLRSRDTIVLHASSLQPVKRLPDLIRSAERAGREDPTLRYLIIGAGPGRRPLEKACRAQGVADRFRFVGWVDHDRMPAYLRLADLVVMPSAHETQSLVYLEAQASGRLLLASDIPAAREVIADGETGLLFRMGDPEDLTAKTLVAAAHPGRREAIGRTARARVTPHALETVVAAYEATLVAVALRPPGAAIPADASRREGDARA